MIKCYVVLTKSGHRRFLWLKENIILKNPGGQEDLPGKSA